MKSNPLVSIVISVFNGQEYIRRSVESAINQTYKNIEVIVVNDFSTDNTKQVLEELKQEYKDLIVIDHKENKGGSAARNTGMRYAKGKYIALLDDDDAFLTNKVEKQLQFMLDKSLDVSLTSHFAQNKEKWIKADISSISNLALDVLQMNRSIGTSSVIMFKRNVFVETEGFDQKYRRHQDIEFLLKILRKYEVGILNEPLSYVYARGFRSGSKKKFNAQLLVENKEYLLSDFKKDIEKYPKKTANSIYARHWLQVARFFALEGNFKECMKYLKKSLEYGLVFNQQTKILPHATYFALPIILIKSLVK